MSICIYNMLTKDVLGYGSRTIRRLSELEAADRRITNRCMQILSLENCAPKSVNP